MTNTEKIKLIDSMIADTEEYGLGDKPTVGGYKALINSIIAVIEFKGDD